MKEPKVVVIPDNTPRYTKYNGIARQIESLPEGKALSFSFDEMFSRLDFVRMTSSLRNRNTFKSTYALHARMLPEGCLVWKTKRGSDNDR